MILLVKIKKIDFYKEYNKTFIRIGVLYKMKKRLEKIKEIFLQEKQIDVSTLSQRLNVSEVTIRRDLDKLEKEDFLKKTYGGAILLESNVNDNELIQLLDNKADPIKNDRELIAEIVMELIKDGESIYLGSGLTSIVVARYLKKRNRKLTIFTNDLLVASILFNTNQLKVVLAGGEMLDSFPTMTGVLAEQLIDNFYLQKAFIEVNGVDFEYGYSLNSFAEVQFIKKLFKNCKEHFVIADHTLFGKVAFSPLGKLNDFNNVVSNIKIPVEYKEYFFEKDIALYNSCNFS